MTAHAQTILTIIASTLAICGVIWRASRAKLDPILDMVRDLQGQEGNERRGIVDRPGILERQTATERRQAEFADVLGVVLADLRTVKAQVTNNGGSSMKDAVDRTEAAFAASRVAA